VRKKIKILMLLLVALAMAFLMYVDCIRAEMISSHIPEPTKVTDSIIVHFTHGYTVDEGCKYDKPTLGGYWGGHVEVEIDSVLYGHTFIEPPVHIFENNEEKNGRFEILTYEQWTDETEGDMITSIVIPIDAEQETDLDSLINAYSQKAPYDYAFFGQRCTSFMVCFLSQAGVFNEITESEAVRAFFYPRALRFSMLEYAAENQLNIRTRSGAACRSWEGD
jgi:hypothetical protein